MRFHVNLANHDKPSNWALRPDDPQAVANMDLGKRSLLDPTMMIAHQLMALGHEVGFSDGGYSIWKKSQKINIVFEGFTRAFFETHLKPMHAKGARFIIIATEEPTPTGFNHGLQDHMVRRQEIFPEAAALADAIWCLVPGTEGWYGQFGAPAAYLDLGWSPGMMRIPLIEPKVPYGFFGSQGPRRTSFFQRLARSGVEVLICQGFPMPDVRDAAMAAAKVILQVRAHEKMGLVSSSRCCTSLFLGRPVLAEPHELSGPWPRIVRMTESLGAFNLAVKTAHRYWREMYVDQIARFKDLLPPEACVGRVLRETGLVTALAA